jgi:L-threonylcarbamoyladenylate synthase
MSTDRVVRLDLTVTIDDAVTLLKQGQLVAFPTETVYGLGADALNARALAQVYRLKGRPANHPVIVHLAALAQVDVWVQAFNPVAMALAQAFWPGPLTLILPRSGMVPDDVTGGYPGVGVRVPRHPVAQQLLTRFDGGIAAPSANRYGQLSPTQANHVRHAFGADCPALLEGGPSQVGLESTIVDVMNPAQPYIRRVGHISAQQLSAVLDMPLRVGGDSPAPGTIKHHYAPRTPLSLITSDELPARLLQQPHQPIALVSWAERPANLPDNVVFIALPPDAERYNRRLYAALHEADAMNLSAIWVLTPPMDECWQPALDRLTRAATAKDYRQTNN